MPPAVPEQTDGTPGQGAVPIPPAAHAGRLSGRQTARPGVLRGDRASDLYFPALEPDPDREENAFRPVDRPGSGTVRFPCENTSPEEWNGSKPVYHGPKPRSTPATRMGRESWLQPARRTLEGISIGVGASVIALASAVIPCPPTCVLGGAVLAIGLGATLGAMFGAIAGACESRERARDAYVGRLTGAAIGFFAGCFLGSVVDRGSWARSVVVGAVSGAVLDGIVGRVGGRLTLGKIMAAIALVAVVLAAFRMLVR